MEHTLNILMEQISSVHTQSQAAALQQVNYWLTARNWLAGCYILEYEQQGSDRAIYGERVLSELARMLRQQGVSGFSLTNLKLCRQFYQTYPTLLERESAKLQQLGIALPATAIGQTLSDQLASPTSGLAPSLLLSRLSFSHFIELLKLDTTLQRNFYEVQAIKNNWSCKLPFKVSQSKVEVRQLDETQWGLRS